MHTGLFEPLTDHYTATRLYHPGTYKQPLSSELIITHPPFILLKITDFFFQQLFSILGKGQQVFYGFNNLLYLSLVQFTT